MCRRRFRDFSSRQLVCSRSIANRSQQTGSDAHLANVGCKSINR